MKKFVLFALLAGIVSGVANADVYRESIDACDEAEMRAALDKATAEKRAVITIVECENGVVKVKTKSKPIVKKAECDACDVCETCGKKVEQVVKREYFVRETIQQYKPVVQYVPAGTYTRVKPACDKGC
ncbi:MAG: hypothetical protein IKZ49_04105 [Alphaproteobacteria bacterium]|nr:hypothetical protein [Alphaproteobacteria bacterium]